MVLTCGGLGKNLDGKLCMVIRSIEFQTYKQEDYGIIIYRNTISYGIMYCLEGENLTIMSFKGLQVKSEWNPSCYTPHEFVVAGIRRLFLFT